MQKDVLGEPYQSRVIELPPDDEGPVVATLVSRRASEQTGKAVLYVHGFNDYFFQQHLADFFVCHGFDFYALDLRKYGRSWRPYQTPNFARSMAEYFPELDAAARIIRDTDDHRTLLLAAHSTGGLIGSLWAHARAAAGIIDGVVLNSPFFDLNAPWLVRRPAAAVLGLLAGAMPYRIVPLRVRSHYGRSLHADFAGEWRFDLAWKPVIGFPVRIGWLQAVRVGQQRIRKGLDIGVPVLVVHSGATFHGAAWRDEVHDMDAVLDVSHIARWAPSLGDHVTVVQIEGGKHDLALSREPARTRFFTEVSRWLHAYM